MKDSNNNKLEDLRKEVDCLDSKIIKLLEERISISAKIGIIKQNLNLPTYTPEREEEIKNRISALIQDKKKLNSILKIYESVLYESRAMQNEFGEEV